MKSEIISYGGWERNLLLTNGDAELLVTLDVGPRVLIYRAAGGENVFNVYPEHLGGRSEPEWRNRGGHRFWFAPEGVDLSYCPDNEPIDHTVDAETGRAEMTWIQDRPQKIQKVLSLQMAESGSEVKVEHRATNLGAQPLSLAPWALSVMAAGGRAIVPQPPLGVHPRDLLPNRKMILWPYTDLADPRWSIGPKYWQLSQDKDSGPTKIGLAHREKWVGYAIHGDLFIKTFDFEEGAAYPDDGCNCELFTNQRMLEVESLGPLVLLQPGESVSHWETWNLSSGCGAPPVKDDALEAWLDPLLTRITPKR